MLDLSIDCDCRDFEFRRRKNQTEEELQKRFESSHNTPVRLIDSRRRVWEYDANGHTVIMSQGSLRFAGDKRWHCKHTLAALRAWLLSEYGVVLSSVSYRDGELDVDDHLFVNVTQPEEVEF